MAHEYYRSECFALSGAKRRSPEGPLWSRQRGKTWKVFRPRRREGGRVDHGHVDWRTPQRSSAAAYLAFPTPLLSFVSGTYLAPYATIAAHSTTNNAAVNEVAVAMLPISGGPIMKPL